MNEILYKILFLAIIPICTISIGGFLALNLKNSSCWRNAFLHFSAGVVLSVVVILFHIPDKGMDILFSFGIAALLYLVSEKLLSVTPEEKETDWRASSFLFGFLLFLILGILV